MKIKKLLLFLVLTFAAFVSAWFYLFKVIDNPTEQPPSQETLSSPSENVNDLKNVSVSFDYQNENSDTFNYQFERDETAYEVTRAILDRENIPYETKQYDFGVFVQSINGLESTEDKAWIYFVNGESANVGADTYVLSDGDSVEWRYIKPEE